LPKLREMLNDAGIQLGQANVGTNMPNQQQAQQQTFAGQSGPGRATNSSGHNSSDGLTSITRTNNNSTSGRGMVDTFV
ncbi:MAG: flagellar hook-length control protein FliK, partial [Herbaspirillum sp.]